jgi:hypothetical protein
VKKFFLQLVLCCIAFGFQTFAQTVDEDRWQKIGTSTAENGTYYVEKFPLQFDKSTVRFWSKSIYKPATLSRGKKVAEIKTLYQIDFSDKTIQILEVAAYDVKGSIVYSDDEYSEAQSIIPETVGESIYNYADNRTDEILRELGNASSTVDEYAQKNEQIEALLYIAYVKNLAKESNFTEEFYEEEVASVIQALNDKKDNLVSTYNQNKIASATAETNAALTKARESLAEENFERAADYASDAQTELDKIDQSSEGLPWAVANLQTEINDIKLRIKQQRDEYIAYKRLITEGERLLQYDTLAAIAKLREAERTKPSSEITIKIKAIEDERALNKYRQELQSLTVRTDSLREENKRLSTAITTTKLDGKEYLLAAYAAEADKHDLVTASLRLSAMQALDLRAVTANNKQLKDDLLKLIMLQQDWLSKQRGVLAFPDGELKSFNRTCRKEELSTGDVISRMQR